MFRFIFASFAIVNINLRIEQKSNFAHHGKERFLFINNNKMCCSMFFFIYCTLKPAGNN